MYVCRPCTDFCIFSDFSRILAFRGGTPTSWMTATEYFDRVFDPESDAENRIALAFHREAVY